MGVDRQTFVGVAIIAKNVVVTEERFDKKGCSNPECKFYKRSASGKFCTACGSPIEKYGRPVRLDKWDIMDREEIDENEFFTITNEGHNMGKDVDVHTCNIGKKFSHNLEDIPFVDLIKTDIEKKVDSFKKYYQKEIEIFERYYEEVDVKFIAFEYYY